jgi:hypothetical protein
MTMVNREGRWRSARVMSVLLRRVERAEGEVPHSSLPPHARSPIHLVFLCTGLYVPCEAQGILVSGENKPPNKHQARPPQDRHCYGRRLRPQAPGPHPLRLRRLNLPPLSLATTGVIYTPNKKCGGCTLSHTSCGLSCFIAPIAFYLHTFRPSPFYSSSCNKNTTNIETCANKQTNNVM